MCQSLSLTPRLTPAQYKGKQVAFKRLFGGYPWLGYWKTIGIVDHEGYPIAAAIDEFQRLSDSVANVPMRGVRKETYDAARDDADAAAAVGYAAGRADERTKLGELGAAVVDAVAADAAQREQRICSTVCSTVLASNSEMQTSMESELKQAIDGARSAVERHVTTAAEGVAAGTEQAVSNSAAVTRQFVREMADETQLYVDAASFAMESVVTYGNKELKGTVESAVAGAEMSIMLDMSRVEENLETKVAAEGAAVRNAQVQSAGSIVDRLESGKTEPQRGRSARVAKENMKPAQQPLLQPQPWQQPQPWDKQLRR